MSTAIYNPICIPAFESFFPSVKDLSSLDTYYLPFDYWEGFYYSISEFDSVCLTLVSDIPKSKREFSAFFEIKGFHGSCPKDRNYSLILQFVTFLK